MYVIEIHFVQVIPLLEMILYFFVHLTALDKFDSTFDEGGSNKGGEHTEEHIWKLKRRLM